VQRKTRYCKHLKDDILKENQLKRFEQKSYDIK